MSSNHHRGGVGPSNGEIEHVCHMSDHFGALYLNEEYSDIILKIEDHKLPAHKVILAARSDYFRALLYGGLKESTQYEIELKDTNIDSFKALLKYIYTGHMSLGSLKEDLVLDILGLAHQFGFMDLETAISDYLRQTLSLVNVTAIYDAARLYQQVHLSKVCAGFMDNHAAQIILHDSFTQLSPEGLKDLLQRDSFYAPEVDIFRAVVDWAKMNGFTEGPELDCVLSSVRLELMSVDELLGVVRPLKLVTPDTILDALTLRTTSRDSALRYRGALKPDDNVAHANYGTQVLQGEMRSSLLDGDSSNYDMERGYTRHAINEAGDNGILIKLGKQFIVNHIRMLLWDRDLRSYCYYIEVSMDQKDWTRVIDHTSYFCRSWQDLYFEPRVVRYVRIVGTNNTVNKVFHVVSFEIMYKNTWPKIEKGLIVPKHNVATVAYSASVIEGVSRSRNALLDGDTKRYDWDSGYTCHQLGSGSILVQLGQPYLLDSMSLLLWDCDDRSYSYYVDVSVNMWDWETVWDKSRENSQSWQSIHFTRRPVVFIRIIGTRNTANEVFHCVHLACWAEDDDNTATSWSPTESRLRSLSKYVAHKTKAQVHSTRPDVTMLPPTEATEPGNISLDEEDSEEEPAISVQNQVTQHAVEEKPL